MSINPIDKNSTPNPTGSLEDLFRHHLGEEAAVPPRPLLWDQIDNSLLIRQNETYRRRLVATRWVAAASLVLASLAGTGWWSLRDANPGEAEVATSRPTKPGTFGSEQAAANRHRQNGAAEPASQTVATATPAASAARAPFIGRGTTARSPRFTSEPVAATRASAPTTGLGAAAVRQGLTWAVATAAPNAVPTEVSATSNSVSAMPAEPSTAYTQSLMARSAQPADSKTSNTTSQVMSGEVLTDGTVVSGSSGATRAALLGAPASTAAAFAQASFAATLAQLGTLAARSASLSLSQASLAPAPGALPTAALPTEAVPVAPADAHRWHYGASYTAGLFNPNVNFSRAGIESEFDYNPALGADSPALTEAAAAQYRDHLRPGLGQRIALLASRHLAGHWSLRTGVEFGQATAKSASTAAFVGEQVLDLGQPSTSALRTTSFRYRTASVPAEVRYDNPVKRGWSLYGRIGGAVSALLGVRSEVEGSPEATRTYSFMSAGAPYRRMLGSLRGGAGAQYRSGTGHWAFTLGPVAEMGLVPLNAHPAQSYLAQSRPYSFGVEAGVEFGR